VLWPPIFLSFLDGTEKSGMLIQTREPLESACQSVLEAKSDPFGLSLPQRSRPGFHYPLKFERAGESYCSRGGPYV
jgi:hypothetical protein